MVESGRREVCGPHGPSGPLVVIEPTQGVRDVCTILGWGVPTRYAGGNTWVGGTRIQVRDGLRERRPHCGWLRAERRALAMGDGQPWGPRSRDQDTEGRSHGLSGGVDRR